MLFKSLHWTALAALALAAINPAAAQGGCKENGCPYFDRPYCLQRLNECQIKAVCCLSGPYACTYAFNTKGKGGAGTPPNCA